MVKVKIKQFVRGVIKKLDKTIINTERAKDHIVNIKEKTNNSIDKNENVPTEYAGNRIRFMENRIQDEGIYHIKNVSVKSIPETKNNVIKAKEKVKTIKAKQTEKRNIKAITKNTNEKIKSTAKNIKIGNIDLLKSNSVNIKKVNQNLSSSYKASQRAKKFVINNTKRSIKTIKAAIKGTVAAVKAIVAGTKAIIYALAAGGTVAVVIIVLICLIGLLCGSIFGIFFSSHSRNNERTMDSVIREINQEFATKIDNLKTENMCDEFTIEGTRANWQDVLVIYTVLTHSGTNAEVMTLSDSNIKTLKQVFWDMNIIETAIEERPDATLEDRNHKSKTLKIKIIPKTINDMMLEKHFNPMQQQQVKELTDKQYKDLWKAVLYGDSSGNMEMVLIAQTQLGQKGGEPYWKWYGFDTRVEWCAIFVSWVSNQAKIGTNVIPKFSVCQTQGVPWFKMMNEWQDNTYVPNPGEIIFFDWEQDGKANHVGIVEKVENNKVYTIEGNSRDEVKRKEYKVGDKNILGYGTPTY